jgi:hypothetical protein
MGDIIYTRQGYEEKKERDTKCGFDNEGGSQQRGE